ncbi:histidine phosphatase family protein [Candidatus Woesearchaeota archaeon]|jgi:phosphoserine phosphatase|nr:histidine phosphatase family protein [Candidatus Woesearchaeota archaeon]MBT6519562.1 histidine phosphatase family protein [Candidatus Woesearchaeota archaeon]MBT7367693.1 histidine phosphatase family protein [Candidatus Woesearchaeota archaeon]
MKLIIVRHGETYENREGISQGQKNSQLTESGVEQAKKVAVRLSSEKIDVIYSSDLDRAMHTAKEILQFHSNIALVPCKELREQAKGVYEGLSRDVISEGVKSSELPYFKFRPLGGESMIEVFERTKIFFNDIKERHSDETVLLVSHGGPIGCVIAQAVNLPAMHYGKFCPRENTAVSVIEINNTGDETAKADVVMFNSSDHLTAVTEIASEYN